MVAKKKVEELETVEMRVDGEPMGWPVNELGCDGGNKDMDNPIPCIEGDSVAQMCTEVRSSLLEKGAQVQMKGLAMAEKLLDDFGTQKPPYNEQQLKIAMTAMDLYNAFKA